MSLSVATSSSSGFSAVMRGAWSAGGGGTRRVRGCFSQLCRSSTSMVWNSITPRRGTWTKTRLCGRAPPKCAIAADSYRGMYPWTQSRLVRELRRTDTQTPGRYIGDHHIRSPAGMVTKRASQEDVTMKVRGVRCRCTVESGEESSGKVGGKGEGGVCESPHTAVASRRRPTRSAAARPSRRPRKSPAAAAACWTASKTPPAA